jgi:hypothetical protein
MIADVHFQDLQAEVNIGTVTSGGGYTIRALNQ